MKKNCLTLTKLGLLLTLLAGLGSNRASAQVIASDNAANYASSAVWTNNSNAGYGFVPWVFTQTNASNIYGGRYLDTGSQAISTSTKSWGVYGNGSVHPGPYSFIYRGMSNALAPNEVFKVKLENNGMNTSSSSPGFVGFCLRSDSNTTWVDQSILQDSDMLFAFYNVGNVNDCYIWDANGATDTGTAGNAITWAMLNKGITVEFYLLSANTYELIVKDATDTTVLGSYPVSTLTSSANIVTFAGFELNNGGGQNAWFNGLEVDSVSIVPPVIDNLSPTNGSIYAAGGSQFSFNVSSMFSTVVSNGVSLVLNGVNESNQMTFSGSGTASMQVTLNPVLQANVLYNGTIVAADANGNYSTNAFTFNTWVPETTNIYIEVSDYNYSSGDWVNNFTTAEPNQLYGQYDFTGNNGIDYYVYNLAETNVTSPYRAGDLPFLEPATDQDHDNFASDGFTPYDMGYNDYGQWEDYTRELSNNVTYAVYARMAGFPGGTMSFERMATPEVGTTSQPGAVLGTFVCPDTGNAQAWTFVPLKDFFSNPALINSGGTNTFRITDINGNGNYNVSYLVLVAVTNSATIRPYITSGFPYPNITGVSPAGTLSFTIANGQTSVNPASIKLFLNSSNITSAITLSNNAAGTVVSYVEAYPNLYSSTNTVEAIFSDGFVTQTDVWQFTAQTLPSLPTAWALPLTGSYARGFSEQIAKGDDSASSSDFVPSVARALAQLAGTLTNSTTLLPYANEAQNGGTNIETDTINYAIDAAFSATLPPTTAFPDISPGTTNNVALAADLYAYLTPGVYTFNVYSDDGFMFTAGATPASTNMILGIADYGRAPTDTGFSFICNAAGLYPMQLIYFKAQQGGGGVELYSTTATGDNILLNDSSNANAVPVYYLASNVPTLSISVSGGVATITWSGSGYTLESASVVTGPYTTIPSATSPYTAAANQKQQYFRLVKSP